MEKKMDISGWKPIEERKKTEKNAEEKRNMWDCVFVFVSAGVYEVKELRAADGLEEWKWAKIKHDTGYTFLGFKMAINSKNWMQLNTRREYHLENKFSTMSNYQ